MKNIYNKRKTHTYKLTEKKKYSAESHELHSELKKTIKLQAHKIADIKKELDKEKNERKYYEKELQNTFTDLWHGQIQASALFKCANVILEHSEFDETVQSIYKICKHSIRSATGYVGYINPDGETDECMFLESGNAPCNFLSEPDKIDGLIGEVYRSKKVLYDNDYFADPSWKTFLPDDHPEIHNILFCPLVIKEKVIGLIGFANKPEGFTENDAQFVAAFSKIVAVVLHNRHKQESLENSETRFNSVAKSASDAIITINSKGKIIFWNQAAETIFGYSCDEINKHSLFKIIPGIFKETDNTNIKGLAETLAEKRFETIGVRKNRNKFPLEFSVTAWKKGRENLFIGTARDITVHKWAEDGLREGLEKLQRILGETVNALASTTEKRDPYTANHQHRVAQLACAIAKKIGMSEEEIKGVHVAGTLHDLGKIYIPAEILVKTTKLTDMEFGILKTHPQVGYDIVKGIEFSWPVASAILQHHERLDSTGYPSGLSADEITMEAKVLAVADVVEAISSHRPYRPSLGVDKAMEEISKHKGTRYDAKIVNACLQLFSEKNFNFTYSNIANQ